MRNFKRRQPSGRGGYRCRHHQPTIAIRAAAQRAAVPCRLGETDLLGRDWPASSSTLHFSGRRRPRAGGAATGQLPRPTETFVGRAQKRRLRKACPEAETSPAQLRAFAAGSSAAGAARVLDAPKRAGERGGLGTCRRKQRCRARPPEYHRADGRWPVSLPPAPDGCSIRRHSFDRVRMTVTRFDKPMSLSAGRRLGEPW
jgi:hypothetical protein